MRKLLADKEVWSVAWPATARALEHEGALLLCADAKTGANAMTIGWATAGPAWGRRVFIAWVRPQRYTYGLLEATGDFTVAVLNRRDAEAAALCGSASGREMDKLAACGFTLERSHHVTTPTLVESVVAWECRVLHQHNLDADTLDPTIAQRHYPQGDLHRLFYGEVLRVTADTGLLAREG